MTHQDALPAVFSNLAKAADKQQEAEIASLFSTLSGLVLNGKGATVSMDEIRSAVVEDGENGYQRIREAGEKEGDRGVLRAAKWGEKVNTAQRSLIDRFASKGEELLDGKSLFVCEACGFIFVGTDPPPVCPVCKAPSGRFAEVK
jgi:rubrerythrin